MNNNIRTILKDKGIRYSIIITCIVLVLELITVVFLFPKFPPVIPLFNSLSWGKDRLVPSPVIFAAPVFLVLMALCNIFITSISYRRHALLARMITINLLLTVLLSLVALAQILLLIF